MLKNKSLLLRIKDLNKHVNEVKGMKKVLKDQLAFNRRRLNLAEAALDDYENAIILMEYVTKRRYESIVGVFEATISAALKDVFDNSYEFKFAFGKRGNAITCEYHIINSEYPKWHDIKYSHGRSVQEVIAVILRIMLVKLDNSLDNVIILDEPLGGLEPTRDAVAAKFLSRVAKKLDMQIIVVTQSEKFSACSDNVVEI